MLPAVTGLHQVSQDPSTGATVFAWTAVDEADVYDVDVDGTPVATVPQSATPTVTIRAAAGSHTLAVAPVADATPAADLAFTVPQQTGTRNPLLQAFTSDSYPNMPIGSLAQRVAAGLILSTIQQVHSDTSIILMDPSEPLTKVCPNGGFSAPNRCQATSQTPLATVPMAASFLVPSAGHNYSAALVNADGKTYAQGGSFARCVAGSGATIGHVSSTTSSLYGDATGPGGRGGSGMDSLAGTIRVGELRPGATIRHAIAIDLDDLDNSINKFVWPATKKDSYPYNGKNQYAVPGCLVALPLDFDIAGLRTEPGRILAQAFHDYGGYNGNDTKGPGIGLCTEWSPAGTVVDTFLTDWGYPFAGSGTSSPWIEDVTAIFAALDVIVNNGPTSIGGGGAPIVPLSPPLA
jgi:hypothetical protein